MTTILVDMDGVLAWWEKRFISEMKAKAPHIPVFEFGTRTNADASELHRIITHPDTLAITGAPGFYRNLDPIEGGKEALEEMLAEGYDVALCTAPSISNLYCGTEKMEWVADYLGPEWLNRLIITRDKTRVKGDYLIDDRSDVRGSQTPEWEHILFTQSYNQHITDRRRIANWSEWRTIVEGVQ